MFPMTGRNASQPAGRIHELALLADARVKGRTDLIVVISARLNDNQSATTSSRQPVRQPRFKQTALPLTLHRSTILSVWSENRHKLQVCCFN